MKNSFKSSLIALLLALALLVTSCELAELPETDTTASTTSTTLVNGGVNDTPDNGDTDPEGDPESKPPIYDSGDTEIPALTMPEFDLGAIPWYTGIPYYAVNGNEPYFTPNQYTGESYEYYSELDSLGRCGIAVANIGIDLMPTEDRGSISSVKPTGWQSVQYDSVDGKYLYNRCHLIGFQLSGENANKQNLITGTRYMNVDGMLPFENMVADYVKETENHVLLRVTPVFIGQELVARGVLMEARSIEDNGEGVCFNVFVYNVQPGIVINFEDGTSYLDGALPDTDNGGSDNGGGEENEYVLNTSSKKFHHPDCSSVKSISEHNKELYVGDREDLISEGYSPCGNCDP